MTRFFVTCFFIATFSASLAAEKMNVLLITADDLGVQIGCLGDQAARTPNLDKLAERGCLYERAYVAQASCSPSRSAMFTGLYPHANGQYGLTNGGFKLHEPISRQTIPVLLKQAGYQTGIIGKLHVEPDSSFTFDARMKADMRDVKTAAAEAGRFMKQAEGTFFLMANFSDPHVMGRGPRPPAEAFPTQYLGVPETPLRVGEVPPFPFQLIDTKEQIERVTQYYNAVTRFDAAVGLMLKELEESGQAANTLVLLVGDHGPPFVRGKTSVYEGGTHVPMFAIWPGVIEQGTRSKALVSTVDLLPTILDAAGVPAPSGLHGKSLRQYLQKEQQREFLATEMNFHGPHPFSPRRALRNERYKLIHNLSIADTKPVIGIDGDHSYLMAKEPPFAGTKVGEAFARIESPPEFELYDLQNDPWEFENLADSPEHAEPLAMMKAALLKWREETADPLLSEEGVTLFRELGRKGVKLRAENESAAKRKAKKAKNKGKQNGAATE